MEEETDSESTLARGRYEGNNGPDAHRPLEHPTTQRTWFFPVSSPEEGARGTGLETPQALQYPLTVAA